MNAHAIAVAVPDAAVPLFPLVLLPALHVGLSAPVALFAVSAAAMFLALERIRGSALRGAAELESLRCVLEAISARISRGSTFRSAVLSALHSVAKTDAVAKAFAAAMARVAAGEGFGDAMRSVASDASGPGCSAVTKRELQKLAAAYDESGPAAVGAMANALKKSYSEARERRLGSIQRSATVSMVAGTVVPSFMTFALVGYSIMYSESFAIGAFAVALLVFVPGIYRISNGWIDDA